MEFDYSENPDRNIDPCLKSAAADILEQYKQAYARFSAVNRQMDALEYRQDALARSLSPGMLETDVEAIVAQMDNVSNRIIELRGPWQEALRSLEAVQRKAQGLLKELEAVLVSRQNGGFDFGAANSAPARHDEAGELLKTLLFTANVIAISDAAGKQRISDAYADARSLAATIGPTGGSMRPRILACLERFDAYRTAGDVAAAGWMLLAVQERLAERDLDSWQQLNTIAEAAVRCLPQPGRTALH